MLHYDVLGFQTDDDQGNFADYVEHELRMAVDAAGFIAKTNTRLGSFPIGIDVQSFAESSIKAAAQPATARLRASLQTGALAIGVDRIDYSKGLENRLRAFDQLFQTYPGLKRQISLLQIALPSRSEIPHLQPAAGRCRRHGERHQRTPRRGRLDADPLPQQGVRPIDAGRLLPDRPDRPGDAAL